MRLKRGIIPVFVPHRGCPNDCVFCNQKKITGHEICKGDFDEKKELARIDKLVAGIKSEFDCLELAFYGGSFTAIPINEMKAYLHKAKSLKDAGVIDRIRLSTRPDKVDEGIIEILKDYTVDCVELGVQSMDSEVLELSKRGCTPADVKRAIIRIKKAGIELGVQLMLGLPGDTEDKCIETARILSQEVLRPDFVRLYPALVIKETEMAQLYEQGMYKPFEMDQAIWVSACMVRILGAAHIPVIRIGLQPTENMVLGQDILAGPFHPSFRQMVDTELAIGFLKEALKEAFADCPIPARQIEIRVPRREISTVKGLSKSGEKELLQWLKTVCGFGGCLTIRQSVEQEESDEVVINLGPADFEKKVTLPNWKRT